MDSLHFTRLMTAKILHDLASPMGSIGMSVELINDAEVRSILEKSYFQCDFKLKFYRLIFSTSESGPNMQEAIALLNSFALHQGIDLNWRNTLSHISELTVSWATMLIGFVYLCLEMLIRGGNFSIEMTDNGLFLKASGPICKVRENHRKILMKESAETADARNIFVCFLMQLVEDSARKVRLKEEDCAISLYIE
jgi:hypothetical protein